MNKQEKLDKIALNIFFEGYERCTEIQQKHILKKYYQEEEKIGVCAHCGTHCDYDVFNCTGCNAPLDKPLRSSEIFKEVGVIVKGHNNTTISNVIGSTIIIGSKIN